MSCPKATELKIGAVGVFPGSTPIASKNCICTEAEHQRFLDLCPQVEKYIVDGGIQLIKVSERARNNISIATPNGTENCGYTSFDQCWATIGSEGGWCHPNPFPGTPYGTGYTSSGPKR